MAVWNVDGCRLKWKRQRFRSASPVIRPISQGTELSFDRVLTNREATVLARFDSIRRSFRRDFARLELLLYWFVISSDDMDALELQAALVKLDPATTVTPIGSNVKMLPARHRIAFTVDLDENDLTLENAGQNDEQKGMATGNVVATTGTMAAAGNAARKMHNNCSAQLTVPSHQNHPNNRQIEVAKCEMAEVRWRQPCFDLIFYHTYPPHRGSKHHAKHHAKEKRHHHHHTMHHQHHRSHVVSQWRSIRASDRCHPIVVVVEIS